MKPTYEIVKDFFLGIESKILKKTNPDSVVSWIPIDEANKDYQDYLKWVAEGNVAEEWNQ